MTWLYVAIAVLAVLIIALVFVGTSTFRLGHETPAAIFDLDEAVDAVGDSLPGDVQARVTYDDVRQLILATLAHLREQGISARPGEDVRRGPGQAEVIVRDDDTLAIVLGRVEEQGLEVSDVDAATVIEGLLRHLDDIGALGPRA